MAAVRCSALLATLLVAAVVAAAAHGAGRGRMFTLLMKQPVLEPAASSRQDSAADAAETLTEPVEGSGDGADDVSEGAAATGTALQAKQDNPFKTDNIFELPTATKIFFNYGGAMVLLTYLAMGVGYFYGPYSLDAFLAKRRQAHRIHQLKKRLNMTDAQKAAAAEVDYGYYIDEEVSSLIEDGDYGGGYDGYGGGYDDYSDYDESFEGSYEELGSYDGSYGGEAFEGQAYGGADEEDSYVSYEGQIARRVGLQQRPAGPGQRPQPDHAARYDRGRAALGAGRRQPLPARQVPRERLPIVVTVRDQAPHADLSRAPEQADTGPSIEVAKPRPAPTRRQPPRQEVRGTHRQPQEDSEPAADRASPSRDAGRETAATVSGLGYVPRGNLADRRADWTTATRSVAPRSAVSRMRIRRR